MAIRTVNGYFRSEGLFRRKARNKAAGLRRFQLALEPLEGRQLLATLTVGATTNAGHIGGSQSETSIAINPTNPNNIVITANDNSAFPSEYESVTFDGGVTWSASQPLQAAQGKLPASGGDGTVAFDAYGNLYFSYLASSDDTAVLALSIDGGKTFSFLGSAPSQDQPKVATGPGHTPGTQSVWVEYLGSDGSIGAIGTESTGLGQVGQVTQPKVVPNSSGTNFGKLSIGPNGQVLMSFQDNTGNGGPATIYTSLNPSGIGGLFSAPKAATTTNVGGFDYISAQAQRSIDSEAGLAYDYSSSVHRGRVYLVYTEAGAPGVGSPGTTPTADQNDTEILLRFSDDDGQTWTSPLRVNDDPGKASQFFPRVAVDPTSGIVGLSWFDTRNDPTNFAMTPYATASLDAGVSVLPNVQVWNSPSNATLAPNNGNFTNNFGDYSGLSFYNGVMRVVWPDNSAGLSGNTDSPELDIASAPITVSTLKVTAVPIVATELTQFSGVVATITPSITGLTPAAFVATIAWGDGTVSNGTISTNNNGKTFSVTSNHIYNLGGKYTVTINVTQSGTLSASVTTTATVAGLPINATGTTLRLNEGDTYSGALAHFVDTAPAPRPPGFYAATINFGDGSLGTGTIVASPTGGFDVYDQGGHVYGGGNYTVTITITDPGASAQALTSAFVTDSALHATGTDITPTEGTPFTFPLATFTDDDPRIPPLSNYYATVDWGDGTISSGSAITIVPNPSGPGFAVEASHPYNVGSYSVVVTIGNYSGGNSAVALTTANVVDAPLFAQGYDFNPLAGTTFSGILASFTDGDPRPNPTSNYVAKVDWGDGTKGTALVDINEDGGYLVRGSHAYGAGTFTISTTISDIGGAQIVTIGTASVPDAPVTLAAQPGLTVGEGESVPTTYAIFYTNNLLSPATAYRASITLFDGTVLPASVLPGPVFPATIDGVAARAFFEIVSDAPYSSTGNYLFDVILTNPGGTQVDTGGSITVTAAPVSAQGTILSSTSKTILNNVAVASFTSSNPKATASEYTASINWGDNSASTGLVAANGLGGFVIVGTHTYPQAGSFITTITINGDGGYTTSVQGAAIISNLLTPITGGAIVSSGVISETGLTNSGTPIFKGTAEPLSTVNIFATLAGGTSVLVATGTATATGSYTIVSSPLGDGQYTVVAQSTDTLGHISSNPTVLYPTASRGKLTVDTQGPKVNQASLNPRNGTVTISLTDGLSGLSSGVLQAGNYSLQNANGRVYAVTGISVSPVTPNTQQTVTLTFSTASPLPKGKYVLRIDAHGIADLAGNALDERYFVPFPSLYNQTGQNYVASFTTNGKAASIATQFVPPKEVIAAKNHRLFVRKHFRHK